MSSQTLNGRGGTHDLAVGNNITSGTLSFGANASRSGTIEIGNSAGSGDIIIDSGSSDVDVEGNAFNVNCTGSVAIGNQLTAGSFGLFAGAGRTGQIIFGNAAASGNIIIDAGSSNIFLRCGQAVRVDEGITFDNGTNIMSAYAQGTFSPVLSAAGTSFTLTSQVGHYERIGRFVMVQGEVQYSAKSGTGTMRISGLPINLAVTSGLSQTFTIGSSDCFSLAANDSVHGRGIGNTDYFELESMDTSAGTVTAITNTAMDGSGTVRFAGSYYCVA